MKKTWIRLALVLLVMAVFLFFSFRRVNWGDVLRSLGQVSLGPFLLILALTPLHLVTRSLRWRYLLAQEKRGVKFHNLFAGNAIGFTVSYVLPGRVGELVRPIFLARKEGIRSGFAIGTVVVERIFDIITMCALLGVFLAARPLLAPVFQFKPEAVRALHLWGWIGLAFSTVLLALCLLFYFFKEKALSFAARILKPFPDKVARKIVTLLHEFIDGLAFFHSLANMAIYFGLSFMVWLGIILFYWIFLLAYGVSVPYFLVIPYIFLTAVGASIPTPGMVGGFHYFSILGLTALFGVDPNRAAGLTIVVHALQLVVTCAIGYVILWKEGLSVFQLKKLGETTEP